MQTAAYLLLIAGFCSASFALKECPPIPEECVQSNPCETATCLRYVSTECCVYFADGECKAEFYRLPAFKQVTDCNRGIERCEDKVCPGERVCMEEVLGCPERNPDCGIMRIKSSCVFMPSPRPPVSCDEVLCEEGFVCTVEDSRNGEVAKCRRFIPKSCDELTCDEGYECRVRENTNGEPVARCILQQQGERPSDCSQLQCPKDMTCVLLPDNGGARCAKVPPPKNCEELQCEDGLECVYTENGDRVRCAPVKVTRPPPLATGPEPILQEIARKCEDLDCEPGYECKLVGDRERYGNSLLVATCIPAQCPVRRPPRPPRGCHELVCGRDEMCTVCGEGRETRARCVPRREYYLFCVHVLSSIICLRITSQCPQVPKKDSYIVFFISQEDHQGLTTEQTEWGQ